MNKIFALIILCFAISSCLFGQIAIPSAGGEATGSEGSASYSIGQVVYITNTGITGSVAQGVQQPYEISVVTELKEAKGINLSVSAYPNPTSDYLTLSITLSMKSMSYQIYDINGKLLRSEKIKDSQTHIAMGSFICASYLLKVNQNNTTLKTLKIIKN